MVFVQAKENKSTHDTLFCKYEDMDVDQLRAELALALEERDMIEEKIRKAKKEPQHRQIPRKTQKGLKAWN